MSELRRYIEGLGGDAELLVGWEVYIVERPTDNRKKHADRYYYSPSKKKYRSKVEIARHFGLVKESAPRLSKNPRPTSPPRTTPRLSSPTPTSQTLPTLLSAAFAQSPNLLFPSDFQPYPVEASADLMTLEEADEPYPTSSTPSTISIIECSRCSKLHSLPSSIQSESLRSSSWTCNDNHWKPADSFCSQHSNDFEESSSVKSSCLESDTTTTTTTDVTPFTIPFEISYKTPIIIYVLLPPSNGSFKSPTPNISSFLKTLPFPQILVLGPVTLLHNKDRKEFSNKPIVKTGEGVELLLIRSAMTAMSNVCETFPYSRVYFASAGFGSRVAGTEVASTRRENQNH
ncbi:hypothetical protein TL16_g11572 [Triparma laevis f. inornata]|uniref:MBD domain-containing protein n=1 Tax=Triparma laevis f. inornata TaxID=1714386 RepID=A0A9W7BJT7_9STRA|nr:hypothetical protein TL16_g11572 [Triparma laevis f. inornata]